MTAFPDHASFPMYLGNLVKVFNLSGLLQKHGHSLNYQPDVPKKPEVKIEYNNSLTNRL